MHQLASTAPKTRKLRGSLALLLGLSLPIVLGAPVRHTLAEEPVALTSLSDTVDSRAYRWVAPAIKKLDAELTATADEVRAADPSISLATWAAYGSGFLRHVTRGRDLDCLAVFDLGTVPAAEAAEQSLARVETILRTFVARTEREQRDPGLAAWKVEGADAEGRIENRALGLELLQRALPSRTDRALSVLLPRADGTGLATVMTPGEVPLPAMADAAYLSDAVRYREGMPTAIRQVSVMLFFAVEVVHPDGARRRFMLTPSLSWLGLPIPFEPLAFFLAFPHARARDRFAGLLNPTHDLLETRLWLAADLLRTGRSMYEMGSATKALKRMHQALDVIGPGLEPAIRASLERNLATWLEAPSARELSDLEKVATIMKEVARAPHLHTLYVTHGTVDSIAAHFTGALTDMARQHPEQRDALLEMSGELARLAAGRDVAESEAWAALAKKAAALATDTGPDPAAVERDLALLEAPLIRAGWRFLPVLGAENNRIQISEGHLASARVFAPALLRRPYGDFTFEIVSSEAEPTFYLPLRLKHEAAEERALARLRRSLACEDARLRGRMGGLRVR